MLGYNEEDCCAAGVVRRNENGSLRDHFQDRIVIPNIVRGEVVHLTGRALGDEKPKYLHLPGKNEYFWGEFGFKGKEVIVAEGPFDALALKEWGYDAVALFGCGLKEEFAERLGVAERIIFLLDSDEAGKNGVERCAAQFVEKAKIAILTGKKDPAEFFKEGDRSCVDEAIKNATDFIFFQLAKIPADLSKVELIRQLDPILETLSSIDERLCEGYLSDIKERFGLNTEQIKAIRKSLKQKAKSDAQEPDLEKECEQVALLPGIVVDVCEDENGRVGFLVKRDEQLTLQYEIEHGDKVYLPPPREAMTWLLPKSNEVIRLFKEDSDSFVFSETENLLRQHIELPEDCLYSFFTAWIIHTHLIE